MQYDFNKNFSVVGVVDLSGGSCYGNSSVLGYKSHYRGLNCSAYGRSGLEGYGIDR
jgi:hypothetical protein